MYRFVSSTFVTLQINFQNSVFALNVVQRVCTFIENRKMSRSSPVFYFLAVTLSFIQGLSTLQWFKTKFINVK